ncbi:MAG: DUF4349 domain-containing protein [Chloroflexi bacterium]|nr:DUF4349 domain-containing protein [Chloroflexota bacterium]MCL5276073.1 DUF4349 domain-containing protein [Chloroflexota bacterium]
MLSKTWFACLAVCGFLALAACSSASPSQIASYPRSTPVEPTSIAREPYPRGEVIPYDADIELAVGNVDVAAERATELAYQYGGYPAGSQSWFQDGQKHIQLELSVPAYRFDSLRRDLLDLGTLIADRVSNEVASPGDARGRMTHVTVHLRPAVIAFPFDAGWNPAQTFASAFGVVASIFRVLADIAIWLVVVIGPFALIGLVVWVVVRQLRRPG